MVISSYIKYITLKFNTLPYILCVLLIIISFIYLLNFQFAQYNYRTDINYHQLRTRQNKNILQLEYEYIEQQAYQKLINGIKRIEQNNQTDYIDPNPFSDLQIAKYIPHKLSFEIDDKYFIGLHTMQSIGKDFIVYSAGLAGQSKFENYLINHFNVTVHGFDCTDYQREYYNFTFYPWCIGKEASFESIEYAKQIDTHIFYSIKDIKTKLNHKKIHLLKLDIEGFEWNVIQNELIDNNNNNNNNNNTINNNTIDSNNDGLPEQLLIEIHSEGSNPSYVPSKVVKSKRIYEINQLVLALWKKGYRLMNIILNKYDQYCAELSFIRITI